VFGVRERKHFLMEDNIMRNKNSTSFGMKTFIAFMVRAIYPRTHMV
jgi:hypothetical protein